jgi:hypothetical protein
MGFFSRFFKTDKLDQADPALSRLPDDAASEIGLDASTAAAVLSEIDIDTAIAAHENWKLRLQNVLDGNSAEDLRPELVRPVRSQYEDFMRHVDTHGVFKADRTGTGTKACSATRCAST